MPRQLIAESWNEYRRLVMHPDSPEIQVKLMRQAFYCGAQTLFFSILGNLTPGADAEPADEQMLTDLQNELTAFANLVTIAAILKAQTRGPERCKVREQKKRRNKKFRKKAAALAQQDRERRKGRAS